MSGVNKVILVGRVGQDPDVRSTQGGDQVATLSVATSEQWKDKQGNKQENTEWHRVILWRRLAEIVAQYVKKGDQIYIEGKLQTRQWEQDGVKRYTTEIVANQLQMLGGQGSQSQNQSPQHTNSNAPRNQSGSDKPQSGGFDNLDDDIPFN